MAEDRVLPYGDALPPSWLAALQEFIGTAEVNFALTVKDNHTVQVVAGPDSAQVGLGIDGLFRYISSTITAAVTGGAALYDIYATCGPNNFVVNSSPPPPELDDTDYSFALQVVAHNATPTLTSGVSNFRLVGLLDWDGAKITGVRPSLGHSQARAPITPTSPTKDIVAVRAVAAASQTAPVQTWETSTGTVVGTMTAAGALTLTGDLIANDATFSGILEGHSLIVDTNATVDGTMTLGGALTAQDTAHFEAAVTFDVTPTMPTASAADNSTKGATTAYVTRALTPGAWTDLALVGGLARWTGGPGGDAYTPAARVIGDRAELRGDLINSGSTIPSGGLLCTLASQFRPTHPVYPAALTSFEVPCQVQILPSGAMSFFGPAIGLQTGDVLPLDGLGYSLS